MCIGFNWLVNLGGVCALLVTWLRAGHEKGNYSHVFTKLLLILILSLVWVRRENEFASLILLVSASLSFALTLAVREWLVRYFQKMEVLSNWERVVLHCWFPAKFKISYRTCTDHKCLLQYEHSYLFSRCTSIANSPALPRTSSQIHDAVYLRYVNCFKIRKKQPIIIVFWTWNFNLSPPPCKTSSPVGPQIKLKIIFVIASISFYSLSLWNFLGWQESGKSPKKQRYHGRKVSFSSKHLFSGNVRSCMFVLQHK